IVEEPLDVRQRHRGARLGQAEDVAHADRAPRPEVHEAAKELVGGAGHGRSPTGPPAGSTTRADSAEAVAGPSRRPTRYHVSTSPLPFTSTIPRGASSNSSRSSSYVARVTWICPGVPCDSI